MANIELGILSIWEELGAAKIPVPPTLSFIITRQKPTDDITVALSTIFAVSGLVSRFQDAETFLWRWQMYCFICVKLMRDVNVACFFKSPISF